MPVQPLRLPQSGHALVRVDNVLLPGATQVAQREIVGLLAEVRSNEVSSGEHFMRYKLLGRSGLRVSELALGTMTFGPEWGWGASKEESRRIFDAYAAAGGNFIDTANRYTEGTSERFVGEFIAADRDILSWRPNTPCSTGGMIRAPAGTAARTWCSRSKPA